MRNKDKDLIEASKHYAIAECGGLARISTPHKVRSDTKMGVGFDYIGGGYMKFMHRHKKLGNKFSFLSHRMKYYLHHGEIPEFIDHIDGNPLNNSIENLRSATRSQNNTNKRAAKNSSSKYLGVGWHKRDERWHAQICVNNKNKHLGYFTDEKEAAQSYDQAASKYFGEFANLNFK